MQLNTQTNRQLLAEADIYRLFLGMGWDNPKLRPTIVTVSEPGEGDATVEKQYRLTPVAQKRGAYVFECTPVEIGGRIPAYADRQRIEREARKSAEEHIIVFVSGDHKTQVWQWVLRRPGQPAAYREQEYRSGQRGEALLDKLDAVRFRLSEEENLTITGVVDRITKGFDVERVTKKFYDLFKREHERFRADIANIAEDKRDWYASLMLNRLMFIYFIQRKKFLDGDANYLGNRLKQVQARYGSGKYQDFYRHFLLRLFHFYLNRPADERPAEPGRYDDLLGRVPYLNGGLFGEHDIERDNPEIAIPDAAFERIFAFFDNYQWRLDERPIGRDNEINPDVLGYIFEKYINQKQMGAYYTKEDITGYITQSTIIPYLFDAAAKEVPIAFRPDSVVWQLLRDDPDRYIYPAVKTEDYLLTETEREYKARRLRCAELRVKLAAGEVHDINDLITYNLNIRQFAEDAITASEGPDMVRAFYYAIAGRLPEKSNEHYRQGISVLDPTCGSGAFLFAALNVLEPLYDACLRRMDAFIDDADRLDPDKATGQYRDFRATRQRIAQHPNRAYFIYKSIIINNLYGVDIMDEAVEIARLRLFLKLAAQVEFDPDKPNMGLEPLPDIDFNIVAGNTLVGYVSLEEVRKAVSVSGNQMRLVMGEDSAALDSIVRRADAADEAFQEFRRQQVQEGAEHDSAFKQQLRDRLDELNDQLDRYLSTQYGYDPRFVEKFKQWRASHQPLHWFVEFYGIIKAGGFDVIVGNPPYVEYSKVKGDYTIRGYETESCGNLYANVLERCMKITHENGYNGMIVQLPIVCTDRMIPAQKTLRSNSSAVWISNYDDRPARLFDGLEHIRASIILLKRSTHQGNANIWTTKYNRWLTEARSVLFSSIDYANSAGWNYAGAIPKVGESLELNIARKISGHTTVTNKLLGENKVYFHNAPQYWIRAMTFAPYFRNEREGEKLSTQVKTLTLPTHLRASVVSAILNSNLFYWWFIVLSDCRHLNMREIERFPVELDTMKPEHQEALSSLNDKLMFDYQKNARRKTTYYKTTGEVVYDEYYPRLSKAIIDQIDRVLAQHYGFTDEELDFIINYDIKYRMGKDADEGAE